MSTWWNSQQGEGEYTLQFGTDNREKYRLVEKAAQMAIDGKTVDNFAEVVRCGECEFFEAHPEDQYGTCGGSHGLYLSKDDFCSLGERKEKCLKLNMSKYSDGNPLSEG